MEGWALVNSHSSSSDTVSGTRQAPARIDRGRGPVAGLTGQPQIFQGSPCWNISRNFRV